jgi:hypothetical protein
MMPAGRMFPPPVLDHLFRSTSHYGMLCISENLNKVFLEFKIFRRKTNNVGAYGVI